MTGCSGSEAIICGGTRVWFVDPDGGESSSRIWSSDSAAGLSDEERLWFRAMDECKPSPCGKKLLLSSSYEGGVAVIRQDEFELLFAAHLPNAHSIEETVDGWILAAGSMGSDKLVSYDPESRAVISEHPMRHAHGVIRDSQRGVVWAAGGNILLSLDIDGNGAIRELNRFELPEDGAHDLWPARTLEHLDISTSNSVWRFDIGSEAFAPHPLFEGLAHVKSIDENADGRWAIQQAPEETGVWWNDTIRFQNPDSRWVCANEKLYKARWNEPHPFRYSVE